MVPDAQDNHNELLILLIDDDTPLRTLLRLGLARHGFRICEAEDGEKGVDLFRTQKPDMVITDLIMPNQEGLETIGLILELDPEAKIIAMSGNVILPNGRELSTASSLECAAEIGAKFIFQKPFEMDELLAAVNSLRS